MKSLTRNFIGLISIIIASCHRQEVYEPEYLMANIPIVVDWTKSSVDEGLINSISVYFYPTDGGDPVVNYSSDPYFITTSLVEGTYDIVVHNEIEGNIKGIDCTGSDSRDGYSMMIQLGDVSQYDMFYDAKSGERLVSESEPIATWIYEGFEVTKDLIEYTRTRSFEDTIIELRSRSRSMSTKGSYEITSSLTKSYSIVIDSDDLASRAVTKSLYDLNGVQPTPATTTYNINIEIDNMNNIQYIEGILTGLADGIKVFSGTKILAPSGASNYSYFAFSDHTFDAGSTTNGTLRYILTNLGHPSQSGYEPRSTTDDYTLIINAVLQSGELYTKEVDVTDIISTYTIGLDINIDIGDSFGNDTDTIVLPENAGAGFGVAGWGDNVVVEL